MRVLHLIPTFGSGGAERQLAILANGLAADGLDVHIGYCRGGPNLQRLIGGRVAMHRLKSMGTHDIVLAWRILRLIERLRPDVLQTWLLQMDILGGIGALLTGVPLIVSERSSGPAYAPGWKSRLRVLVGSHAARIVANSRGGIDYWRAYLPSERICLVRNCVLPAEAALERPIDATRLMGAGRQLVLFAGRFSYEKNIPRLVEALMSLARERPSAAIIMFGEGPERLAAERRIAASGLGQQVEIRDFSSQLSTWLSCAAVCVSVSNFEGHPNVVMEAAAAGCPLVLSDIPAHRELFDESSAFWAPPDSTPGIVSAVLAALQNPHEARERAWRAHIIASQFDSATVAGEYRSIYEDCCSKD